MFPGIFPIYKCARRAHALSLIVPGRVERVLGRPKAAPPGAGACVGFEDEVEGMDFKQALRRAVVPYANNPPPGMVCQQASGCDSNERGKGISEG